MVGFTQCSDEVEEDYLLVARLVLAASDNYLSVHSIKLLTAQSDLLR